MSEDIFDEVLKEFENEIEDKEKGNNTQNEKEEEPLEVEVKELEEVEEKNDRKQAEIPHHEKILQKTKIINEQIKQLRELLNEF